MTTHATDTAPPEATTDTARAYQPMPSVARLVTELVNEEFWARYAKVRGDAEGFHPEYLAERQRTALLLRAVIADLFALADPSTPQAAADAGRAANTVRRAYGWGTCSGQTAREWLRERYEEWEKGEDRHPPNCPGGCGGTGETMAILIWQDDGAPLHQEPILCLRGEPDDPHPSDCICGGSGEFWERGERNLCLDYRPQPVADDPQPAPGPNDPWATAPPAADSRSLYGKPPF
jgi:hypothetical protein